MYIEKFQLRQFRSHLEQELYPHPVMNIFYGENGAGKTNLLEAIHFCAVGRSHRSSQDKDSVMRDQRFAVISLTLRKKERRWHIQIRLTPGEEKRKTVLIDHQKAARLSQLMGVFQCVMFSPEDLSLIKGSPAVRRRWLDMMISQVSRDYFTALQQYQKYLEQRNALLKAARMQEADREALMEIYEAGMAAAAERIIRERRNWLHSVQLEAEKYYRRISGRDSEALQIRYVCCIRDEDARREVIQARLKHNRAEDQFRGTTLFGPHREELLMHLSGREMKTFASQGQCRTAVLSLKLSQMCVFEQMTGEKPVLLLDDVMSELDLNRRSRMLKEIQGFQTFITCTDLSDLTGCELERCYEVRLSEKGYSDVYITSRGSESGQLQNQNSVQDEDPDFT